MKLRAEKILARYFLKGMAIGTDIVLGVSRAAEPARQRAAVSRLEELSGNPARAAEAAGNAADTVEAWAAEVRRAVQNVRQPATVVSAPEISGQKGASAAGEKKDPYVQFEALLVQNMIEQMMPEDLESVFGSGTAGKVWKSMLSEKIAMQIAQTGTLGIAKQIAKGEAAAIAAATRTKGDNA